MVVGPMGAAESERDSKTSKYYAIYRMEFLQATDIRSSYVEGSFSDRSNTANEHKGFVEATLLLWSSPMLRPHSCHSS